MIIERKNGFTLVELLAVIVILAIILVISVPKVMNVIKDTTKASLESSAKMVAAQVENQYTVAKTLNKEFGDSGSCMEDWAGLNDVDYASCTYEIEDGNATVTIGGKGKFKGLSVCNGTRSSATAIESDACPVDAGSYIKELLLQENTLHNGLIQTMVTYTNNNSEEVTVNSGIRYVGSDPNNKVYYNCEDTYNGVSYGNSGYDYSKACEVWRIAGLFEVENENGDIEQRIKIINTNSTFKASWDSSENAINKGYGINQWGDIKDSNGTTTYLGADLMQLLNGYYIGKSGSECKYNNISGQSELNQTCDTEGDKLKDKNMKPLTNISLNMIDNAVWYTYATDTDTAETAYLQERGITKQYIGCLKKEATGNITECERDNTMRKNEWIGLIGLMSVSDMIYSNGWLRDGLITPWTISSNPYYNTAYDSDASYVWHSDTLNNYYALYHFASNSRGVWPNAYLKSNIKIIGGDGSNSNPYKLSI